MFEWFDDVKKIVPVLVLAGGVYLVMKLSSSASGDSDKKVYQIRIGDLANACKMAHKLSR